MGVKIYEGGLTAKDYFSFILEIIKKIKYPIDPQRCIFFADNARIHHCKDLINKFSPYVKFQFNVPYSPQLNPIEVFFSFLKKYTRTHEPESLTSLIATIQQFVLDYDEKNLVSCFLKSLNYYIRALKREKF